MPGFLVEYDNKNGKNAVRLLLPQIKGTVLGSIFHEIGYLLLADGEEAYRTQGELSFDHVNRGMGFAPIIIDHALGKVGSSIDSVGGEEFSKLMIRATDFNKSWPEKERKG